MQFFKENLKVHFIGIGGVGMQTLAGIMLEKYADGISVSGSDLERSQRTELLRKLGAKISYGHDEANLPDDCDLVVYSSAVPVSNPEYMKAQKLAIPLIRRGELLAELSKTYEKVVIISGSHGKTSTCATLVHLLKKQGVKCGYLIGGELHENNSFAAGDGSIFVTEADESDGTHVFFAPDINIVVNLDDDHAWSVGGEEALKENFRLSAKKSTHVLYWRNEIKDDIFADLPNGIPFEEEVLTKIAFPGNIAGYQKKNSFLALQAMKLLNLNVQVDDLSDFINVKRRMTMIYESCNFVFIEDYAHHPKELKSSLSLLREKYPDYQLHAIFQVHRAARMTKYFEDFAEILGSMADKVILSRIFEAWVSGQSYQSPQLLADRLPNGEYMENFSDIVNYIEKISKSNQKELVAIIGAGDIHQIIKEVKL